MELPSARSGGGLAWGAPKKPVEQANIRWRERKQLARGIDRPGRLSLKFAMQEIW
jgi:hypothetical protein